MSQILKKSALFVWMLVCLGAIEKGGIEMVIKKIAFLGTGVMGASVVNHLLNSNYEVAIYTRTKEKARSLIEAGAVWADTVAAAVKDAELVFTMLGYPSRCRRNLLWRWWYFFNW